MVKTIARFSPLTEASYYILLSLVNPLHGYGILKKVEEMSNNRVTLAAGTLYGALSALLDNKLIALVVDDEVGNRRKTYQITKLGRELLDHEIHRLQEMVDNGLKETKE
jgi:DNA-binding PadR family transcriptional regulator